MIKQRRHDSAAWFFLTAHRTESFDMINFGRKIRFANEYQPDGTNVNLIDKKNDVFDMSNEEKLEILRHSLSHVMAAAIKKIWPNVGFAIGPAIENGFYYDFDFGEVEFSDKDLKKIEKSMKKINRKNRKKGN